MAAEILGLLKALIWPAVVVWILVKFDRELRAILTEIPSFMRRLLTVKVKDLVELSALARELPQAEEASKSFYLPIPAKPDHVEPKRD